MANADAVESFLRKNGSTWCDDCIKSRTGISTRQQVNQICRILEQKNVLSRCQGRCAARSEAGTAVVEIFRFYPSSKTYLNCGYVGQAAA